MDKYHFKSLNLLVEALVGTSLSDKWWESPNKAFNNRPPMTYMNDAEWTYVRDYLLHHAYVGGGS